MTYFWSPLTKLNPNVRTKLKPTGILAVLIAIGPTWVQPLAAQPDEPEAEEAPVTDDTGPATAETAQPVTPEPEDPPAPAPDATEPVASPEPPASPDPPTTDAAAEVDTVPSAAETSPGEVVTDEPLAEQPPAEPSLTVGVGMRTGLAYGLSGPTKSELSLNDGLVDQVHMRPFMAGTFSPKVGYFVQFEIGTPKGLGSFAVLDAIGQLKFAEELQLWVGQHIPANDRNNMNGPFFGNTWNFAIAVEEYPFDVGARDRGATLWGLIADGTLKYHLSLVDLQPGRKLENARMAGRVTLHLLEPENFYYNSGTYWGTKDVLAFGLVGQYQKGVNTIADSDLKGFSADGFFEKNTGSTGTFTLEGGYWNYKKTGAGYIVNQGTVDEGIGIAGPYPGTAYMGVFSWLTPNKIGVGQIQPNVRVQYADWRTEKRTVVDAGLAYVIDGFNHKYHLNYRHQNTDPADNSPSVSADIIQVGMQYQMAR